MKDYYYILGIEKHATDEQIKSAYKKLAVKFHPDKNNGDKFFEERFKDIQEAYETLSDPIRKRNHDATLKNNTSYGNTNTGKAYEEELKRKERTHQEELRRQQREHEDELRQKEEELKRKYQTPQQRAAEEAAMKKQQEEQRKQQENNRKIAELERLNYRLKKANTELVELNTNVVTKTDEIKQIEQDIKNVGYKGKWKFTKNKKEEFSLENIYILILIAIGLFSVVAFIFSIIK